MAGGGVALIRAKQAIAKDLKGDNDEQNAGIKIVLRAMEEPLRQIVKNAGDEPSVVVNKVADGDASFGYNAQTGVYGDMIEMGVLDPTKVTRTALQNAASASAMLLTTEAGIVDIKEPAPPVAAAPGMGGGMGGQPGGNMGTPPDGNGGRMGGQPGGSMGTPPDGNGGNMGTLPDGNGGKGGRPGQ